MGKKYSKFSIDEYVIGCDCAAFNLLCGLKLDQENIDKLYTLFIKINHSRSGKIPIDDILSFIQIKSCIFFNKILLWLSSESKLINFLEFAVTIWNFLTIEQRDLGKFAFMIFDGDVDVNGCLDISEVKRFINEQDLTELGDDTLIAILADLDKGKEKDYNCNKFNQWSNKRNTKTIFKPLKKFQYACKKHILGHQVWNDIALYRQSKKEYFQPGTCI